MKEKILQLRSEGKSYNEIKKMLGCSKSTISFHCGIGQKDKNNKRVRLGRKKKMEIKKIENQSMDDKTWIGGLAELKVMAELTKQRFYVFNQVSGKAPFDLIAYKSNKLFKISVKGTYRKLIESTSNYEIQIGRVRSNKNKNVVHKFNNNECDFVAVYIFDLDTVCFINSNHIKSGRVMSLRKIRSKHGNADTFIIDELSQLKWE